MTPTFTAGTRQNSLQNETGLFVSDFSVKPNRTVDEVMGVANAGDHPAVLYLEAYNLVTEFTITGTPIRNLAGALQGLGALADAATIASLANLADDEFFGLALSSGTLVSTNPELKKARSGTGVEITLNPKHFYAMN